MELSERIYQLRKAHQMTQQELADTLGVSRQAVSRWEMGSARPDIGNLTTMSKIFGISLDELVTGEQSAAPKGKKTSDRIWWIIWGISVVGILAILVACTLIRGDSLVAIHPVTLIVQVINLALGLGILILLIRWLYKIK